MNTKISRTLPMLALVATLGAAALAPTSAEAHVTRASCRSYQDGALMGTNMGKRNAQRLISAVWNKLQRRCDQVDRLAQIISETPFQAPSHNSGLFSACFYMGYTDTLWEQLGGIYDRCGEKCFRAGTEIGKISAEGYCYASIAVGGLDDPGFIAQPPLPFCGNEVAIGCKTEYVATATFDINACYPYTVGYYESTFENSVRQDCFVPADVPIVDGGHYVGSAW